MIPVLFQDIIFREPDTDRWVIHGLERNIVASGRTSNEAIENYYYMIAGFYAIADEFHEPVFNNVGSATAKFWDAYADAHHGGKLSIRLPTRDLSLIGDDRLITLSIDLELTLTEYPQ